MFMKDISNIRNHRDKIRTYFQLVLKYQANILLGIFNICNQTDIVMGVNLRQGNYHNYQNAKYFYKNVP